MQIYSNDFMLSKEDIKSLIRSYFHDACQYLGIDDTTIPVLFIWPPIPTYPILLHQEADIVFIDTNIVSELMSKLLLTPIRMNVYAVARALFNRNRKEKYDKKPIDFEQVIDCMGFAYTLSMLKGLRLPIPPFFVKEGLMKRIEQIANDEFHEDCILSSEPSPSGPGERDYFLKKRTKALEDVRRTLLSDSILCVKDIVEGKGTEESPFDNIEEAAEFVLSEERKAFESDKYIQDILLHRRFNFLTENNTYNVPWADGNVSWIHPEIPRDSFIVNSLVSGRFSLKPNLYGRKFLYRGQNEYYSRCTPGLFRDSGKKYFLDDMIMCQELQLVCESHPLVTLLSKGINLWHDLFCFEMNYYGLAQHYYNRTCFLDLTSDIEAAKFFAVTSYDRDTDTYVPCVDTGKLGVLYYYELSMPGAFSFKQDRTLSVIGKQVFMRSGQQHGFLLNMEKDTNFNNFPEVHKVFFRHNEKISRRIYEQSDFGRKYFPIDCLQEMWKRRDPHIVSEDTVNLNVMRNPSETFSSIERKLANYGITVGKYKPSFDDDLLDMYYQDIRNGWWQDVFCKDIYFGSDDGIIYKKLLLNVPRRDEYRWAFENKYKNK